MKRLILLAFALFATPLHAQETPPADPPGAGRPQRAYANPSALIAADLAFARLATEKGQWTAFRETADETAEMFEGRRQLAKPLLKDRKDPPSAVKWAPHSAWISCDGTAGLTYGAWQGAKEKTGEYITVWLRQYKGKVEWKWALDDGQSLATPLRDVDWAEGKVADCPARRRPDGAVPPQPGSRRERKEAGKLPPLRPLAGPLPAAAAPAGTDSKDGQSRDGSLAWRSTVMPDGSRRFIAWAWKDGTMQEVLNRTFAADGGA